MDIRETYRQRVIEFCKSWEKEFPNVTEHNIDIMVSIMCTRDGVSYAGGDFVKAVVKNNLVQAVTRADSENLRVLKLLVMCNINCFV